ncbi:glycoside hydrolase family 73 protein [Fructilactobacillus sp. Tb1]|uniref:glycoside hydrolase family 73 protein n=1 Tax=Fructilactobacillus sp. Tb1 TaxID=3422304 RepID=UPI003D28ED22
MAKRRGHRRKRSSTKKQGNVAGFGLIIMIVVALFLAIGVMKFVSSPAFVYYNQDNVSQQNKAFINKILPEAVVVQKKYNILASITLAQAILESNWGQSELSAKYNNLFGVKAGPNQPGVSLTTTEYRNGEPETVTGIFRKYDSWNQSIDAHAMLLAHGTDWNALQYKEVVQADNYKDSAKGLSIDGYATDPAYAQKIIQIIEKYHLNKYDRNQDTGGN